MIAVEFPEPQFRMKKEGSQTYIFCAVRKSWLVLTEEEWVRQNFVQYLIQTLQYPAANIALEKEISVNGLKKRFDILVYNREHQPWMLVECKEPQVPLSEAVLQQVLRYHLALPCSYLVITNGAATVGWEQKEDALSLLTELPFFPA